MNSDQMLRYVAEVPPRSKFQPTYMEIHNACVSFVRKCDVVCTVVSHVVGIERGGLIPATIISHCLKKPLVTVSYSSMKGRGDDKSSTNRVEPIDQARAVLIVDDICDTGNTLFELEQQYVNMGYLTYSYCLFDKQTSEFFPTYASWRINKDEADNWVFFPWEIANYHVS